jgi:hypothetical protein
VSPIADFDAIAKAMWMPHGSASIGDHGGFVHYSKLVC